MRDNREKKFYSSQLWQEARELILIRDNNTCQMCGCILTEGRKHPRSAAVDHKVPISLAWERRLDHGNLWSVCKTCHDNTCARIERQHAGNGSAILMAKQAGVNLGYNADGKPLDPNHPWNTAN